ncbi:MAG: hypothetical protein ACI9EF_002896 [Pseudohongiellaceae bacterium]|jgi:hypothetical protein
MTRTLMLAPLLLACLTNCTDDAPSHTAALPAGFLMTAQPNEHKAPTAPVLPAEAEALPEVLLGLMGNANGTGADATEHTACDTLTIKYRQHSYVNSELHWFTLRGGEPISVEVAKSKSSGGRLVLGSLPLTKEGNSSLSELLDLFRRGYEERFMHVVTVELKLSWSLHGEVVRTEVLNGDFSPFLAGDAPWPILNAWIDSFDK